MEIVYGANIKDHINVIFQNFNRGDLQLNLSKTVPVALIIFCTEVQCCILGLTKAMSVSVVGSH